MHLGCTRYQPHALARPLLARRASPSLVYVNKLVGAQQDFTIGLPPLFCRSLPRQEFQADLHFFLGGRPTVQELVGAYDSWFIVRFSLILQDSLGQLGL